MSNTEQSCKQPYRRHTTGAWEGHKDFIREHLIKQDKTYEDVVVLPRDHHGFDIGVRQLKRKADGWGFFKNIPQAEMAKMVRIREQRETHLRRPTKFIRDVAGGEPQEVPAEKLNAYAMRFGARDASVMSDTPSCIAYQTPTSYAPTSDGRDTTHTPRPTSVVAAGPNASHDTVVSCSEFLGFDTSHLARRLTHHAVWERTNQCLIEGDYGASIIGLKLCLEFEEDNSDTMEFTFAIEVLETALYPGGPYSIVARTADILSRFVIRAREKHQGANPSERKLLDLRGTLTQLYWMAGFLVHILVRQRLIQAWEPVLGREDPKIVELYNKLNRKRAHFEVPDPIQDSSGVEKDTDDLQPQLPNLLGADVSQLLHIEEGPLDQRLMEFRSLESVPDQDIQRKLQLLRQGRYRALEGVYFSPLGRYVDAELAFQDSDRLLELERSVEIHLHRILWHAEHRTRVGDWVGVGTLICRAHQVYMDDEHPSTFVLHHFPSRFKVLCAAASRRVPIDELDKDRMRPGNLLRSPPGSPRAAEEDEDEVSVLSPQRLFPVSPGGGVRQSTSPPGWTL